MEALSIANVSCVGSAVAADKFLLTVCYRADQFQIERSRVEIESLLQSFVGDASLRIEHETYIAKQLNIMFERAGANFWAYPSLVHFIERSFELSPLTRLHFHRLTSNMTAVVNFVESFESRIAGIEYKMDEILHVLSTQQQQQQQNRFQATLLPGYERKASEATTSSGGSLANILSGGGGSGKGSNTGSVSGSNQGKMMVTVETTSGAANINKAISLPTKRSDELASNDSSSDNDDDDDAVERYQSSMNLSLLSKPDTAIKLTPEALVTNLQLVEEIALHSRYAEEVDTVLKLIQPNELSLIPRSSMIALVRGQARVAINSSVFEYGLHEIGANLPHDPVLLSVLLSKSNSPNWNASLGERLMLVAEGIEEMWVDGMQDTAKATSNMNHHIENVENHSDEHGFLVSLVIDTVKVKISSNRRTDLCLLAFFEEVAALVGKNHLFKRSLLLIRAWWSYEASTIMHKELNSYLPPTVITIMVCELFNKYHHRLASPLQALCLFLSEYCSYQESIHIVTLQGLLKFDVNNNRDALKLIPPQPDHLISWEMTEKYWQLFNAAASSGRSVSSSSPNPMVNPAFSVEAASLQGLGQQQQPGGGGQQRTGAAQQFNPYTTGTFISFPRAGFRVLHPFTYKPMTSDRITPRRMNTIVEAFRIGAARLCSFLLQDPNESQQLRLTETVFASVQARFGLPDGRLPSSNLKPVYESQYVSTAVERIWQNILYCNFVMEAVISESAILTATIENLSIRGPLPVGEVGKMLTEICGVPQLSLHLKEKFGGLKKFLERFPEVFVFSNDHPFNPHLLLRSKFTVEHQSLAFRGVVPTQVMTLYKKGGLSNNNKKQQQQQQQQQQSSPFSSSMSVTSGGSGGGSGSGSGREYGSMIQQQQSYMAPLSSSMYTTAGGYSHNVYQSSSPGQQQQSSLPIIGGQPAVMPLPPNYSRSAIAMTSSGQQTTSPGLSSIPYNQSQSQSRSSATTGNFSPADSSREYYSSPPPLSAGRSDIRRETAAQQQQAAMVMRQQQQTQSQGQQGHYGTMYGGNQPPTYDRASGYIPAGIATTMNSESSLLYGGGLQQLEAGGASVGRYGGYAANTLSGTPGYAHQQQQRQQQRLYTTGAGGNRQQPQQQFASSMTAGSGQQQPQQQQYQMLQGMGGQQVVFSSSAPGSGSAGSIGMAGGGGSVIPGPFSSGPPGLAGLRSGNSFSPAVGGDSSAFSFAMGGAPSQSSPSSYPPPARNSFDFARNVSDFTNSGSGFGNSKQT